jgi:hypothetical protein
VPAKKNLVSRATIVGPVNVILEKFGSSGFRTQLRLPSPPGIRILGTSSTRDFFGFEPLIPQALGRERGIDWTPIGRQVCRNSSAKLWECPRDKEGKCLVQAGLGELSSQSRPCKGSHQSRETRATIRLQPRSRLTHK